jgi:hypothetical protein
MSAIFNCCDSVSRYVPHTGAESFFARITKKTTPEEFEQIRKEFPQFQLWHSDAVIRSTILHRVAVLGNVQLIEYLVKQAPALLERGDSRFGSTPLCHAYDADQIDAMRTLLALGANTNIMFKLDTYISLLHSVVFSKFVTLKQQDSLGIDFSYILNKKTQVIKLLLKYGAEWQPEDNPSNPMDLSRIQSIIQEASKEVAAERRVIEQIVYDSNALPPKVLCNLVGQYT